MSNQITPNPSVPSQIVQEVKFPQFVNNLGIIPTSYKDSMSYYETLAWLCKYLEETVIPTLNQNGNAVQELQGLYIELNSYVTHYFDNLDVQEEINNKLDEMAQSGELNQSIRRYIDPLIAAQNLKITSLDSQVKGLASGSPLAASSTSDMTDTSRIYVNTTNGHWYYYNESLEAWSDGGTYQSTEIGESSIHYNMLDSTLQSQLHIVQAIYTLTTGKYINALGNLATSDDYECTTPIFLNKGDTISVDTRGLSNVTIIAMTNENATFYNPLVMGTSGSTTKTYLYQATDDTYVAISGKIEAFSQIVIYNTSLTEAKFNNILDTYEGKRIPEYTVTAGKYIRSNNNISSAEEFSLTSAILLNEGETISFYGKGSSNVVSMISKSDADGSNPVALVVCENGALHKYSYTALENMYVRLSYQTTSFANLEIRSKLVNEADMISYFNEAIPNNYFDLYKSFLHVGCIGDSLASGEMAYKLNGVTRYHDMPEFSWGQFMARASGNTYYNFSGGGITTQTWLTDSRCYPQAIDPNKLCECYMIGLGVNDYSHGRSDYLGSSSDIDLSDYENNGDTFYGNYAGIIQRMKEIAPKAKFFLFTIPMRTDPLIDDYNDAIRYMPTIFDNVYVIDIEQDHYDDYQKASSFMKLNYRGGHYNAMGYNYISQLMAKWISQYMYTNYSQFQQIEFINTDYEWT